VAENAGCRARPQEPSGRDLSRFQRFSVQCRVGTIAGLLLEQEEALLLLEVVVVFGTRRKCRVTIATHAHGLEISVAKVPVVNENNDE